MNLTNEQMNELMGWLRSGVEMAQREAPEVAAEIVRWNIAAGFLSVALGAALFVSAWAWWVKHPVKDRSEYTYPWEQTDDQFFCALPTIGFLFFGSIPFLIGLFCMIQAIVAPRLAVLEYLR